MQLHSACFKLVCFFLLLSANRLEVIRGQDDEFVNNDVDGGWRTIGDCDFEHGDYCHWHVNKRSTLQWRIGRGDQLNETYAPTSDHTLGISAGHFAWTKLDNGTKPNETKKAVLSSVKLNSTVCLSLWYYMDGASFLQLAINHITTDNQKTMIDELLSMPTGGNWKFRQTNIMYSGKEFYVNLEATVENPLGVIAIDDLRFTYGNCKTEVCTFEESNCGYHISKLDKANSTWVNFEAKNIQNISSITFPDHTRNTLQGHMMLFTPRKQGDISWLTSPESDFSGYRCLQFYYYISDDDAGSLEVYHHSGFSIPDLDVDKKNGYIYRGQSTLLLGRSWRKIQLTLPPVEESVIDFIATAGSNTDYSFITVDDISVIKGRCDEPVSCDFEYDSCGWHLDQDLSMTTFERIKPAKQRRNYCVGPPTDHTLQTANGNYLYICYHAKNQLVTTIKSGDFDGHQNWCFSFWIYFTNTADIRVSVYLNNMDGNTQIASIKADNGSHWKYHEMNIAGDDKYEIYYLSIIATPFTFIADQGVAIDDVKLFPHKCHSN